MECIKCKATILESEEKGHNRKIFCEDCYIDVLSPAKFCDPWADYAAKSFVEKNPNIELSVNQSLLSQRFVWLRKFKLYQRATPPVYRFPLTSFFPALPPLLFHSLLYIRIQRAKIDYSPIQRRPSIYYRSFCIIFF